MMATKTKIKRQFWIGGRAMMMIAGQLSIGSDRCNEAPTGQLCWHASSTTLAKIMAGSEPSMDKTIVLDPTAFDEALAKAAESVKGSDGARLFVFLYGEEGDDGNSWCPDCVNAKPIVEAALDKVSGSVIYASCERAAYKAGASFPYRSHKSVMLKALPQLIRLDSATLEPASTLVENECEDAKKVEALVSGSDA